MPEDVRDELRRQYEEELQVEQQSQVTTTNAEKMAFYAALPPEIRDQVMAEEARQERALGAQSDGGDGGGGGSGGGGGGAPPPYQASQQGDSKVDDEQVTNDALDALNGVSSTSNATSNDDDSTMNDADDFLSFNNQAPATAVAPPDDLGGLFDGLAMGGTASAAPVAVQPAQQCIRKSKEQSENNAANPFDLLAMQTQAAPEDTNTGALPTYDEVVAVPTAAVAPPAAPQAPTPALTLAPTSEATAPEPPLERLRKARMLLAEGLIEQNEFDQIKVAVLAQLKGN